MNGGVEWRRRRLYECGDDVEFVVSTFNVEPVRWRPGTVVGYTVADDQQLSIKIKDAAGFTHYRELARVRPGENTNGR